MFLYSVRVSVTHLSALVCDQGGERLGVEAAIAEAQAAVHTVGGQLQSLLTDVVLVETQTSVGLHRIDSVLMVLVKLL